MDPFAIRPWRILRIRHGIAILSCVPGMILTSDQGPDIYKTFSELLHHPYELQLHDYINFYNAVAAGSNGHTTILYVSSLQVSLPGSYLK